MICHDKDIHNAIMIVFSPEELTLSYAALPGSNPRDGSFCGPVSSVFRKRCMVHTRKPESCYSQLHDMFFSVKKNILQFH